MELGKLLEYIQRKISKSMKRIALFVHQPHCSVQCLNGIIQALSPNYKFKLFTRHKLEKEFFDNVDAVCFPGGIGDADSYEYLLRENGQRIKEFVKDGGKYLGICMGAYWAGSNYFDILKGCDAIQYIKSPNTDTRRPHAKAIDVTWNGTPEKMFFYDGCTFTGAKNYKTIATYANGDTMALIQNNIGLIGCHPESTPEWYTSYSWMKPHYHGGRHHKLLLEFTNRLLTS